MRSSVRFSDGLTPKAGAACAIRSGRGIKARFRPGDSVGSLPPGLPWALTSFSVWYELPTHENLRQRRRSRPSSASLVSTATLIILCRTQNELGKRLEVCIQRRQITSRALRRSH